MKKSYKLFLMIILLVIGFASVSTTLLLNGNTKVGFNNDDFDVFFYSAMVDKLIVTNDVLSEDKKTLTFELGELSAVGEKSILDFSVINNSSHYDAYVTINCDFPLSDDYTVSSNPTTMEIYAGKRMDGSIEVTLNKALTESKTIKGSCKLTATPRERTSSVEKVVDRNKYDVVLIGDSIMNGHGNDNKTFDYYLKEAGLIPENSKSLNFSKDSSMLFSSDYVDESQLILDTQIRKYLFEKVPNIKDSTYIMVNGGINDLMHNLQYDAYTLGITSEDSFNEVSYFNDIMASDNLISRIYNVLSGLGMTFSESKIVYIKPRVLPDGVTSEHYKDTALINEDIVLFNKAIDIWYQRIGKSKYPNMVIIDSNDYVLESDLRYSVYPSDGVHWLESAYKKIVEALETL